MPRRDHQGQQALLDSQGLWDYQADKDHGDDQDHQDLKDHEETQVEWDQWDQLLSEETPKDQTQKQPE